VTLAESAIAGAAGVEARCDDPFGEGDGRVVISAREADLDALRALAGPLALERIGLVGGGAIVLNGQSLPLDEAREIWESALPGAMEGGV
jgi:hypothetical protein